MKKTLLIALIFLNLKAAAQNMIYLADGNMVPGKIIEITKDSVRFRNLANTTSSFYNYVYNHEVANPFYNHVYSYAIANLRIAFNTAGSYLVFNPAKLFSDKERDEFIGEVARPHPVDIVVDVTGKLSALTITNETENEINGTDKGKDVRFLKDSLYFVIRKNGRHELFSSVDKALPFLVRYQEKNDTLLSQTPETPPVVPTPAPTAVAKAPNATEGEYLAPDMARLGRDVFYKIHYFTDCLQAIASVNSNRETAVKSINNACDLFLNGGENVYVEVSSTKTPGKKKYQIRDYLNRVMIKAGKFDTLNIEYANIDFASKFRGSANDGFYATVFFVQKFSGFIDGNLVYGDQTKCNVVFRPYISPTNERRNPLNGHYDPFFGVDWAVYLDNIGVEETMK